MVRVNVKKDLKGVYRKTDRYVKQGQIALVNQVHADMNPYVPFLRGPLRNTSHVASDNKAVIYPQKYAKKQFYVPAFNYSTPGTGARWDLKAKAVHGGSWPGVVKRAMK